MIQGTNVFVTGATGLIGGELVRSLLTQAVGRIWALVRPGQSKDPETRLAERLKRSAPSRERSVAALHAVSGDVATPRLGLNPADYDEIRRQVDIIIHSAAETSFIRAAACRRVNIAGAQHLIEFARECTRNPLVVCLSTAFVSGVVANACLTEEDGRRPRSEHHNEYTHSKAVAEGLFRSSGLPVLVVRPSVVLSAGVPDASFARAIIQFIPLLNELDAVPINPAGRPDVVPVQFVVDSIIGLLQTPQRRYDCYHISAGEQGAVTFGELSPIVDRFYQRAVPLRLIPLAQWTRDVHRNYIRTPEQRRIFASLRNYLPFLNMNVVYDNTRLRSELGDRFPPLPPLTSYLEELLALISHDRGKSRWLRARGA